MRPPFPHQVAGTEWLLRTPRAMLGDEMRLGKTRQAVDAAQVLFERGDVDRVLVVAPGEVARSVWADPETSDVAKFTRVPAEVTLIRAQKMVSWANDLPRGSSGRRLEWYVTNYELARRPERLEALRHLTGPRTYLVLDEAVAVKSPASKQTRACYQLAQESPRVTLLNGTPNGDNPGDLYAPFKILDASILGCDVWDQFRSKYAIMGGFRRLVKRRDERGRWVQRYEPVQIVAWTNLEDLYDRTRPYVLRRTMAEVFPDMPPALDPVTIDVPLPGEAWRRYKSMRDSAVLELRDPGARITAEQAGSRVLRLAQLTAGFIGGVDGGEGLRDVGSEKRDAILTWHEARLNENPHFRMILWCRFRHEAERFAAALERRCEVALLYGNQDEDERKRALRLVGPGCADRAATLVGIARTGGLGLDFSGANVTATASNEYSHVVREQALARPLGPNQSRPCSTFDFACVGPDGQRTIDHTVLRALARKEDMATWGAARWARALEEEAE